MRALRIFLFLLLYCSQPSWAASEPIAVIMAADAAHNMPRPQTLALIFKRKQLFWDNGMRIEAVNLPADHPLRRRFSQRVLHSLPEAQTQYWNGLYYHGISPPHVVASAEAVLRFVAETPGAIGYIAGCQLDARVKPVLWVADSGAVVTEKPDFDCP